MYTLDVITSYKNECLPFLFQGFLEWTKQSPQSLQAENEKIEPAEQVYHTRPGLNEAILTLWDHPAERRLTSLLSASSQCAILSGFHEVL